MALAASFALAACAPVAGGSGPSLNDRRLGVIKGSAPGIVLLDAPGAPAAGAASAAAGDATAPSRRVAPSSGQPLRDATRLDSPAIGIPLPSAVPASGADAQPRSGG